MFNPSDVTNPHYVAEQTLDANLDEDCGYGCTGAVNNAACPEHGMKAFFTELFALADD